MARVTGFTAARMRLIEAASIVKGAVNASGRLILETRDGTTIDAGNVRGSAGPAGVGPVGSVVMHAGASAPSGYLLCRGQVVSRTTYAALFAVLGVTYGAGDGSTTFTLPNLQGRVPVGLDATQTEFDALAETGGAKTHTLTVDQMPSHAHMNRTVSRFSVTGTAHGSAAGSNGGRSLVMGVGSGRFIHDVDTHRVNSTDQRNEPLGGDQPHNNLQPYLVMNYIIKT